MQGWISLHRKITDNELWHAERFTKAQAWIDLLLLANHKTNTVFIRGNEVKTERGELCYSMLSLAKRWSWDRKTVNRFLRLLESRHMIHSRTNAITTIISIKNYNQYQMGGQQNGQQKDNRKDTNNNSNNEENVVINEAIDALKENRIEEEEPIFRARAKRLVKDYGADIFKVGFIESLRSWKEGNKTGLGFCKYMAKLFGNNYLKVNNGK